MLTLHDHIEELRAELSVCNDREERVIIHRELIEAQVEQAVIDAEFDRLLDPEFDELF